MTKISDLPNGLPSGDDIIVLNDGNTTTKATLDALRGYLYRVFKASSSDTTTSLTAGNQIPFDATVFDDSQGVISRSGGDFKLGEAGTYTIEFYAGIQGGNDRAAPEFYFMLDSTELNERIRHTYIRHSSGHDNASANGVVTFKATEGQVLKVFSRQTANGGDPKMEGDTTLVIKKL